MPTTPNAQLTKLAIGIASVAALAGMAGRFAPNNPAAAAEADPTIPAELSPAPGSVQQQTAAPRTQAPPMAARQAQAPAPAQQAPLTKQQLEKQREGGKREHEDEDEAEDEWEDDDAQWEHGGLAFFTPAPDPAAAQQPTFTDAAGQQWVQPDPGQAYVPAPVQQQPVTRTRSKHS
jgi:hypothetical protein